METRHQLNILLVIQQLMLLLKNEIKILKQFLKQFKKKNM